MHANVPSSAIHNNQKVERTQESIHRRTDTQNVGRAYNGIVFSLKKESGPDTRYNMDEPERHVKWSKLDTKGQIRYESIYMKYLEQAHS